MIIHPSPNKENTKKVIVPFKFHLRLYLVPYPYNNPLSPPTNKNIREKGQKNKIKSNR